VRVEAFTVAWMAMEAAVAVGSGVLARSVLLTAFGVDSVVELMSGAALLWRLRTEANGGDGRRLELRERTVVRLSAVLLALLCAYVLVTSGLGLLFRLHPDASVAGLAVSAAAVLVMPLLAARKRTLNRTLQSAALRADVAETVTCAYMAAATLAGVALNVLLRWWWADYVAALALLLWLVPETREAVRAALGRGEPE
jgi:divalent metal cation (Fe/Co/Zn/Cd) transporter